MSKEKEEYTKRIIDYIEKVTTPIFNKVLKETKKNRTSVGSNKKISHIYSLYNPHNYRLYFDFEKTNFHPLRPTKPTYKTGGGGLGIINSKEWITKETIDGCNLIVKKNCIQINNKIEPKRWYLILMGDISKRRQQVMDIHLKKVNEANRALKSFLRVYGGVSNLNLLRIWCEEKIERDKQIDKLPIDMIFKTKNVKKAYNELNIEYFGDPIGAANYFSNQGIEDISPKISNSLNQLCLRFDNMGNRIIDMMNNRIQVDNELAINIRTHNKVFKKLDNLLSQKSLIKWL